MTSLWRITGVPVFLTYKRTNLKAQRESFKNYYEELSERKKLIVRYILRTDRKQKHRYHVVCPSPWPIFSAASAFLFVIGLVLWMHRYTSLPLICGTICLISSFIFWFRDIIREGVYMGYHTLIVNKCLRYGFTLFLVSEVMLFFGFFWALMHYSLTPSIFSGGIWPPQGIVLYLLSENVNFPTNYKNSLIKVQSPMLINESHIVRNLVYDSTDLDLELDRFENTRRVKVREPYIFPIIDELPSRIFGDFTAIRFYNNPETLYWEHSSVYINFFSHGVLINPYKIPLLNTAILLTSGFILTVSHSYLREEKFRACYRLLLLTIYFGLYFIFLQLKEYTYSGFSMNDGVYGSIFYMMTGFHGFHVIVGTIFLIVCAFRLRLSHFTANNHFAFEAAAWYWHFVDVIWILLYILLYLWPNAKYFNDHIATIGYSPTNATIFINMTTEYYFEYLCGDYDFIIPTNINFEYRLEKKAKIVSDITGYFAPEILHFEDINEFQFFRLRRQQRDNLLAKIK